MKKFWLGLLIMAVVIGSLGCTGQTIEPQILKVTKAMPENKGKIMENPGNNLGGMYRVDVTSGDLSEASWLGEKDVIDYIRFNTRTIWPNVLPDGLNPELFLENGKNPGLGIRDLHNQGVDGSGTSIGIIDLTLYTEHSSYQKNLMYYEDIPKNDLTHHMHGPAVASLAVGKENGVAPGANLFFIEAKWEDDQGKEGDTTYRYYAQAMERLLDINKSLPDEQRIRVISISAYPSPDHGVNDYDLYEKALKRAKAEGVFVIAVSSEEDYGFRFAGLEREPLADPDDFQSFGAIQMTSWDKPNCVFFPMDSRTTASYEGKEDYTFFRRGGASWVAPYIAGLYAMAVQVKPEVTPELFWDALVKTSVHQMDKRVNKEILIANPVGLINELSGKKYTKSPVKSEPTGVVTQTQKGDANQETTKDNGIYPAYTNFLDQNDYKTTPLLIKADTFKKEDLETYIFDENYQFEGAESEAKGILEAGKNPGLGIRKLHQQGITGQGVRVGIIDQHLVGNHPEYKEQLVAYYDSGTETSKEEGSFHGPAVMGVLSGKTVGVAPEVKVYYGAAPTWEHDAQYLADCLDWMIKENEKLPENDKIRLVSVSSSPTSKGNWYKNGEAWTAAVDRAEKAGILILDCRSGESTSFVFSSYWDGIDREEVSAYKPFYPNDIESYSGDNWDGMIFAPASKRTVVREKVLGENGYRYEGSGGESWAVPYVAGVLAMGYQVDPTLSIDAIKTLLYETAWVSPEGYHMINPEAFVKAIQNKK